MWFVRFLSSSIGKKWIMAVSGLLLLFFLAGHIAGNATLYLGSAAFQDYADQLHSHRLFVGIFRVGLFCLFTIHIGTGMFLFYQNRKTRPAPYRVSVRVAGNTAVYAGRFPSIRKSLSFAARTMPYSGLLTLCFIIIHLFGFSLNPQKVPLAETVTTLLRVPGYGLLYLCFFLILALHIHHGFWSLLQTLGLSHPRYTRFITGMTTIAPVFFLLAAGGIPLLLMCGVRL